MLDAVSLITANIRAVLSVQRLELLYVDNELKMHAVNTRFVCIGSAWFLVRFIIISVGL